MRLAACWAVGVIAVAVLLGWAIDVDWLVRVIPGAVTMKPATAICFVVAALLIGGLEDARSSVLAMLSVLLGIWTVLAVAVVPFAGLEVDDPVQTIRPGLPSLATLFAFGLLALGGALETLAHLPARRAVCALAGLVGGVCLVGGYCLGIEALTFYGPGRSTAMAVHTAACLAMLGWAGSGHDPMPPRGRDH